MEVRKEYQIICIDDDERFLSSLEGSLPARVEKLCSQFDCVFDFVSSPQELFKIISRGSEGLLSLGMIISDQMMPGINGIDLIEQVKAKHPDAVCVLLTGHAGLDSAKYAINRRLLDQYVSKPIEDLESFASLVANLLKRHHLDLEERQRTLQLDQKVEELRVSNDKIKAMHSAAEQVARLSKGLKVLDFDEVLNLVTHEVPTIFQADRGVLCFPEDGCPAKSEVVFRREKCPCTEQDLAHRQDAEACWRDSAIIIGELPAQCGKLQGEAPKVLIPLSMKSSPASGSQQRNGYICLCRMAGPTKDSPELLAYKGSLVRDVVSANLTNAQLYQEARLNSEIDALTGVKTRRVLEEKLEAEYERAMRYGQPFCVAILDMDHFKKINDERGHVAGDTALRELAQSMSQELRQTDVLARYGGDEFAVLMPQTSMEDAYLVMERLRARIEQLVPDDGRSSTVSVGLAQWTGEPADTGANVLRRADAALYAAKHAGRNKVQTAA